MIAPILLLMAVNVKFWTASSVDSNTSDAMTISSTPSVSYGFNNTGGMSTSRPVLISQGFNTTMNGTVLNITGSGPIANDPSSLPIPCGSNERLAFCRECEHTCLDIATVPCNRGCSFLSCYCDPDKGFVRDKSGSCVPKNECSGQCGLNEVYRHCRTCEGRCDDERRMCPLICRGPGCECPFRDGYIRDLSDNCIPRQQCPTTTLCAHIKCPRGQHCILVDDEFCFIPPCHPVAACTDEFAL